MNTSESLTNIAPALAKAWSEFSEVKKSAKNTYDKYDYSTLEDFTEAVSKPMKENGLALVTQVDHVDNLPDRKTKSGGIEHAVQVRLTGRLMHSLGEWIEATSFGEGQDRGDKAIYKAITGARKYLLASMLGLVTSDEPERDASSNQESSAPATPQNNGDSEPNWQNANSARAGIWRELQNQGFDQAGAKSSINGWLAELGVDEFKNTTAEQRRNLWLWLKGEADSYMPAEGA